MEKMWIEKQGSTFQMIVAKIEGKVMWAVCRIDGKSLNDGVISYNFEGPDHDLAVQCFSGLEAQIKLEQLS